MRDSVKFFFSSHPFLFLKGEFYDVKIAYYKTGHKLNSIRIY